MRKYILLVETDKFALWKDEFGEYFLEVKNEY